VDVKLIVVRDLTTM